MAWVVDTNLLLDITLDDPRFRAASMNLLRKRRRAGMVACPITIVELAPTFGGDVTAIREFLLALGVNGDESWISRDTTAASTAWTHHISERRAGRAEKRLMADVLIGAFAERFDGLLTRNPSDFQKLFPALKIESP